MQSVIRRALENNSVDSFIGSVRKTPLILKTLSEQVGCKIYGKAEFKILEAPKAGVGLGYKCVIDLLQMLGAEVYNRQAKEYITKLENTIWTDQFDNTANAYAHYISTGPEIWQQTKVKIHGFVCAIGTGGTLAGVGKYLKEKSNGKTQVWLADPFGSVLYKYVTSGGTLVRRSGDFVREGYNGPGQLHILDEKSISRLLHSEGLYLGGSAALNVVAAAELTQKQDKDSTIVTILCDGAYQYQSRVFYKKWLVSRGLVDPIPESLRKYAVLDSLLLISGSFRF
ncbi:pyridoxal phosphate-dependent enzyme beta subunit [Suillus clintonianus]|uniref:pyridoxal phosphate-dependent enzyme beta subunit n=1 Tax=Suillus clintonianus TaxID=1904413 RepID=UPI001B87A213|nr:pyridoxal phosphate-dependent enzyme beta subunit [Suillus clintonianus]KAG2113692.1 pyridoxal phosphate-dependent enzyme beta subunit [Suillus clintonianus]